MSEQIGHLRCTRADVDNVTEQGIFRSDTLHEAKMYFRDHRVYCQPAS